MHWLLHILGVDTQQSYWYDAWSGCIPALLTSTTIAAAAWAVLRKHSCHVHACFRVGRFPVAGGQYVVCAKHHPDLPEMTEELIREAHAAYYRRPP